MSRPGIGGRFEVEEYCRRRKLSMTTFELWVRHLVSAEDRRKRAEYLRKLRRGKPQKRGKKGPPKRRKSPRRYCYSVRTDTIRFALQAFWGMHVEAMNWSGLGPAEYAVALGLSPPCAAQMARSS